MTRLCWTGKWEKALIRIASDEIETHSRSGARKEMKMLFTLSPVLLCAFVATACMADAQSEVTDQRSLSTADTTTTTTADVHAPTELVTGEIAPRACFIEGFCVGTHTEFCVHTKPCAIGEARDLAAAFCRNHCGGDCRQGNILQRIDCP